MTTPPIAPESGSALLADAAALGRSVGGARSGGGPTDLQPPTVLSRNGGTEEELVLRVADVVVKVHATGTDPGGLAARLRIASDPRLRNVLLAPLTTPGGGDRQGTPCRGPVHRVRGRLVTVWPLGVPVDPERPEDAPWEQAATLLARLHAVPAPDGLPPSGGPARVARAVARLRAEAPGHPATAVVLRAYRTLPGWAAGRRAAPTGAAVVHGDWHLGQLVHLDRRWRLIDVDTLGIGYPVWDLARPAAWYAAGLLAPEAWHRFLAAYRDAGGPGVPPDDPWPALETPARALTVQSAATAVARAGSGGGLDDVDRALVDCCARIAAINPEPGEPVLGTLGEASQPTSGETR